MKMCYYCAMNISVMGIETYYDIIGDEGEYVLMLPGWAAKRSIYRSVADTISSGYRVILVDLPGFTGSTPEPPESWDVDGFTDFVIEFIKALKIKSLCLIGHSFGGRVIIKLMNRPDLPFEINKLVLIDAAGIRHNTGTSGPKQQLFKLAKKVLSEKQQEKFRRSLGSNDYRNASPVMRQCLVKAVNEDLTDLIPNIKVETLLIWGTADTATPISDGETMEKLIKGSGLVRLEGAGHFSFLDSPVIFDRVMKSYFLTPLKEA